MNDNDADMMWVSTNVPTVWEQVRRSDFMRELAAFNAERARLLRNVPPVGRDERAPGPYSGVGGDIPENWR